MINKLKQKLNSRSNKNILTLFSGNVLAQVVPFLFAPWIARIYSPEELGIFAIIFSSITVLATIANGRYEMAIVIPKEDKQVFSLVFLCIIIAGILCLLSFPITLFLNEEISVLIKNPQVKDLLYLIPIIVFLIGVYNPLKYYLTREGKFKMLSYSQVSKSMSQSIFQVIFGMLKFQEKGLIWGYLVSQFFGNGVIIKNFIRDFKASVQSKDVTVKSIKDVAKEYKDFPKYSVWGIFINNIAQNITIFFIASLYGNENLGYYSFMQRYINAPLFLISTTMGQVYMQELSQKVREGRPAVQVFYSYIKKLFILSLLIVIAIYLFVGEGIVLLFGEKWLQSSEIVIIMLPLFLIKFVCTPLTTTLTVLQRQKLALVLQFGIFVFTMIPIGFAKYYEIGMLNFLKIQSYILFVYYLLLLLIVRNLLVRLK